jgi:hypothetical protein
MTTVYEYRAKANEFLAKAQHETDRSLRAQYEQLGRSYLRLAEQAELNHKTDIVYETPARAPQQQQQQQQQIQPKPDKAED